MHEHFQSVLDIGKALDGATVVTWDINQQNELVVMTISDQEQVVMDELRDSLWANIPSTSASYSAIFWRLGPEGVRQSLPVAGIPIASPLVQSLSNGGFVLVGCRCRPYSGGDPDENCAVFDEEGRLTNRFCVGDAVRDVQVGAQDSLWISYFDEGALANHAWSGMVDTSGLMKFDLSGKREWRFPYSVTDCYSLNVTRDSTWLCYYSDFPVARVSKDGSVQQWENTHRRGCTALAFWGENVLLAGGYGEEYSTATRVLLEEGKTLKVADFDLGLPNDARYWLTGRGHLLHYVTAKGWWTLDIRDLL